MKGSFKYTNGQDTFKKKFRAKDEVEAQERVEKTLKRSGCGLVLDSITLGGKRLPNLDNVAFKPHLSLQERASAAEQNMRAALYEYCFDDVR